MEQMEVGSSGGGPPRDPTKSKARDARAYHSTWPLGPAWQPPTPLRPARPPDGPGPSHSLPAGRGGKAKGKAASFSRAGIAAVSGGFIRVFRNFISF